MPPGPRVWNGLLAALCNALVVATVWYALGINWSKVDDGDKLNAFLALLLGAIGVLIAALSYRISSEQHAHFERERDSKALLRVIVLPLPSLHGADDPDRYQLYVRNEGSKAGAGFWYLGIPKRLRGRVGIEPAPGNEEAPFPGDNWDILSAYDQPMVACFTDDFYLLRFMMTRPVEPGVSMPCATVSVKWHWHKTEWCGETAVEYRTQAWRVFGWFTKGPSGRVPETGMLKLRMYSRSGGEFKNYHGGIELPPDDPEEFPAGLWVGPASNAGQR